MDTAIAVNRLRAQFLQVCPEKDQIRRIIKPYQQYSDGAECDPKFREYYITGDGTNLLDELESPPISKNFMENYAMLSNARRSKKKDAQKGIERSSSFMSSKLEEKKVDQPTVVQPVPKEVIDDGTDAPNNQMNKNNLSPYHNATAKNPIPSVLDSQNNSISTLKYNSASPDANTDLASPKHSNKKPASKFARLFIGKKESSDAVDRNNVNGKKKMLPISQPLKMHAHKPSAFDMNFDYDENLDEEDDEDDEDDENDNDKDIHAKFFQLDETSDSSIQVADIKSDDTSTTSHGHSNNDASSNHGTNVTKRISHFPQHLMQRSSTTDAKSGTGKTDKSSSNKQTKKDDGSDTNNLSKENSTELSERLVSGKENDKSSKADDEETGLSDIDSFINDRDLDNLAIGGSQYSVDKDEYLENRSDVNLSHANTVEDKDIDTDNNSDLSDSDIKSNDNASSYGKSLLYSDFSTDELQKKNSISIETDSNSQMDLMAPMTSASLSEYKLLNAPDDSFMDTTFDKAALTIANMKRLPSADSKSQSNILRENAVHGTSSRRSSTTSNISRQMPTRGARRNSVTNTKQYKNYLKNLDTLKRQRKNSVDSPSKNDAPVSNPAISTSSSRRNSVSTHLKIEKLDNFGKAEVKSSQLSMIFKKKRQNLESPEEILEYFSFVAGSKVPDYECLKLSVYIQASEKYKRKPMNISVRKTSTIFDVIGYILYLYATTGKPEDTYNEELSEPEICDPNNFSLQIVDEDGDPFEDNFGKLQRTRVIQSISDTEVVLCKISDEEKVINETETPLPYEAYEGGKSTQTSSMDSGTSILASTISNDNPINQLSYYKPIVGNKAELEISKNSNNLLVKVFLYPNVNPKFNFTDINVLMTSKINDILVKYCKMKNMDPNEYVLKVSGKNYVLDLNDTVLRLDGNNKVEIISKKDARELQLEKIKPNLKKPVLPTIQSNDLTPLTLENGGSYLKPEVVKESQINNEMKKIPKTKRNARYKRSLSKHSSDSSVNNPSTSFTNTNSIFKTKNSSKTSLHGSLPYFHSNRSAPNINDISGDHEDTYQDLFSGAYHKYRVWRRQQMSLINKHERTLALDGDYIYIVPPDRHMHWHENVKTKSLHISQITLVKKSSRIPEYFKIYVKRGQDDVKRYYFEAVSPEECKEIVTRIQNLLSAYKMNHK